MGPLPNPLLGVSVGRKKTKKSQQNGGPASGKQIHRRYFWPLMVLLSATSLAAVAAIISHLSDPASWAEDRLLRYAATRMTPRDKQALRSRLAEAVPGLWQPVPEPNVNYLLQRGIDKPSKGARVRSNAAGMRSGREFTAKRDDRFRIVCVGDSLVMGTGGREQDRWGDQMEALLAEAEVTAGGHPGGGQASRKKIEVYSLGLDGWTALNEATYLASRISDYQPDVVLVMMFQNDVTDSGAVLGDGQLTYDFSSESRADGSGVMIGAWPSHFGVAQQNLLYSGLGSESLGRWRKAFAAWKRLEDLVEAVGGKMLFSFLRANRLFGELCKLHHRQLGMHSPVLVTGYFGNSLPHDPHPDREGHRILAAHYLHTLSSLGWLPVGPEELPPLHPKLTTDTDPPPDAELLADLQRRIIRHQLDEAITFDQLRQPTIRAFLGGIYPGSATNRLASPPFGSTRSAFLLRRKVDARRLLLEIDVPARVELFPFALELRIDGEPAATLVLAGSEEAGRHVMSAELPAAPDTDSALEIVLRTDSYWTEIHDPIMKSYRLLSVYQR